MLARCRSRLSYANVMSTIAVFFALATGGAYAANTVFSTDIVDGEVKSADLAANSVTFDKIRAGHVFNSDLAGNAVSSAKVLDDSLTGNDILESSLAQVPNADQLDGIDSKAFARLGGGVNGDGSVFQGTGFTAARLNDGEYQVTFPAGTLSNSFCPPVVTAVPFAGIVRHPQVSGRTCSGLGAGSFTIKLLDDAGVAHDTPFLFIAM